MLTEQTPQHGFTLIELMIGVAIIGILMAFAIPSYRDWMQNTRIRNTSESILNGLQLARAEAVKRNAQVQFVLGAGADWTVGCVTATANCPAVIQSHPTSEGSAASITITSTPAASTTIIFNSFGTTVASAATFNQLDIDIDPAVLPAEASRELRITIGMGGNSRMCDPSPLLAATDPRAC